MAELTPFEEFNKECARRLEDHKVNERYFLPPNFEEAKKSLQKEFLDKEYDFYFKKDR